MRYFKFCLLAVSMILLTACSRKQTEQYSADIFAMDTYMNLKIYSDNGNTALKQAETRIREIEKRLSVTDCSSDISRINNADGESVSVSDDTCIILEEAYKMYNESNGALDITIYPVLSAWGFTGQNYRIPGDDELRNLLLCTGADKINISENSVCIPGDFKIDTGSLTKGYTGDCLMKLFEDCGISSAVVNLGGNVQTLGRKPDGSQWSVAVANPFSPSDNLGILKTDNQAVITSGNYERYFTGDDGRRYWHIIDPADGKPAANGLVSVTVIGDSGLRCDALSTALFTEGTEKAAEHWNRTGDFEMICVTDAGKILVTEGIENKFENTCGMPVEVIRHD